MKTALMQTNIIFMISILRKSTTRLLLVSVDDRISGDIVKSMGTLKIVINI